MFNDLIIEDRNAFLGIKSIEDELKTLQKKGTVLSCTGENIISSPTHSLTKYNKLKQYFKKG